MRAAVAAHQTSGNIDTTRALRTIVAITEEIKKIVRTAFQVNTKALNALLLARRAGDVCLGFGKVSEEIRAFSEQLQRSMADLKNATLANVNAVTTAVKYTRSFHVLQHAAAGNPAVARTLLPTMDAMTTGVDDRLRALQKNNRKLLNQLEEVSRLGELGGVLANSARIEAAYGGIFRADLSQVSEEFSRQVDDIRQSILELRSQARRISS